MAVRLLNLTQPCDGGVQQMLAVSRNDACADGASSVRTVLSAYELHGALSTAEVLLWLSAGRLLQMDAAASKHSHLSHQLICPELLSVLI